MSKIDVTSASDKNKVYINSYAGSAFICPSTAMYTGKESLVPVIDQHFGTGITNFHQCAYCGCTLDNKIGYCSHCGAPL